MAYPPYTHPTPAPATTMDEGDAATQARHAVADLPTNEATRAALAMLIQWRGAAVATMDEGDVARAEDAGQFIAWTVESDSFDAGYGDLDNQHTVIGVYASLAGAVADVYAMIVRHERVYNPIFTQRPLLGSESSA
jgi:hypothetical protein